MDWLVWLALSAMGSDDFRTREAGSGTAMIVEVICPGRIRMASSRRPISDPEIRRRIELLPEINVLRPLTNLKAGVTYRMSRKDGSSSIITVASVVSDSGHVYYVAGGGYSKVTICADGWPKFTEVIAP